MFDTKKERKTAVDDLKNLRTNPGWGVVVKIAEANIKALREKIVKKEGLDGLPTTEDELDMLRERVRAYKSVIETPEKFIEKLSGGATKAEKDYDPYFKAEDFMTPGEKAKQQRVSEVDKKNQNG